MAETAARNTNGSPATGPAERDTADLGQLIFASLERIREKVRRERECQRSGTSSPSGTAR